MTVTAAAIVPSPPLLARELTGRSVVLPELREACAVAVGRLLSEPSDVVAIVGGGPVTATWEAEDRLNPLAFGPVLAASAGAVSGAGGIGKPGLPLALGIGARLLDEAGYAGPRVLRAIAASADTGECLAAGRGVASLAPRVALLVVGDGSARRAPAAPGYFDERAEAFDVSAETSIRDGDMAALAALDAGLAADLLATGRAAWQVLAGAVDTAPADVLYTGAPFGVSYLVAVIDPR